MPMRAPHVLNCGCLSGGVVCEHVRVSRAAADRKRPSATARGYDKTWRRVRGAFLKANPVCCVPGCGKAATEPDHIQSIRDRPDLRLKWSNLRPFCHSHHSQRTARDQSFGRARAGSENLSREAATALGGEFSACRIKIPGIY